jgi:VanZ family protein
MLLIWNLSSRTSVGPDLPEFFNWIVHFGLYAVLTVLWAIALAPVLGHRATLIAAAMISFAYAISDEIHQGYIPGRKADPFDVFLDCCGIAFAVWAVRGWSLRRGSRRDPSAT